MNDSSLHKVLMVDDDLFFIELNKLTLQWAGLETYLTGVDSALKALDICEKSLKDNLPLPNYILLDLNMPMMDGFEFLEAYQKSYAKSFPETKIIIVTSSSREKDKKQALSFPFVKDYVVKPLSEKFIEDLITPDK